MYRLLEKSYRTVNIDLTKMSLAQAIRDALTKNGILDVQTGGGDIFLKGTNGKRDGEGVTKESYKMPTEDKLCAIEDLLKEIQKNIPDAAVKEIKVSKKGTFEGYVIIPIKNTNITVLENFNDDINEAIFIVENKKIEEVVGNLTKREANKKDGVERANHTEGYAQYVNRLIEKMERILIYPEKQEKVKTVKRKSAEWFDLYTKNANIQKK